MSLSVGTSSGSAVVSSMLLWSESVDGRSWWSVAVDVVAAVSVQHLAARFLQRLILSVSSTHAASSINSTGVLGYIRAQHE